MARSTIGLPAGRQKTVRRQRTFTAPDGSRVTASVSLRRWCGTPHGWTVRIGSDEGFCNNALLKADEVLANYIERWLSGDWPRTRQGSTRLNERERGVQEPREMEMDGLQPYRLMLRGGVPVEHVVAELRRHLGHLQALPDTTEGKAEAIAGTEAFLDELERGIEADQRA